MDVATAVQQILKAYPKIYFACHVRHVADPKSGRSLSSHQASILDHLDNHEPTLVKELAAHMGVTPSTISLHLDRLEKAGFVKRQRDAEDARKVGVLLTAAGERIRKKNSVLDPALVRDLVASLVPADRKRAIEGLELLADAAALAMEKSRSRTPSA